MSELKECPFCGNEADLVYKGENNIPDQYEESWDCICCHCGASPLSDWVDKDKAISIWNTRANSDLEARLADSVVMPEFAVKLTNGREFELSEADVKKALITLACHKFGIVGWPELVVRQALSEGK